MHDKILATVCQTMLDETTVAYTSLRNLAYGFLHDEAIELVD